MREREKSSDYRVRTYSPGRIPLFLMREAGRNSQLKEARDAFRDGGVNLEIARLRRVPAVLGSVDKEELGTQRQTLRESALHITSPNLPEGQETLLVQLNENPATEARRDRIVDQLVKWHRQSDVKKDLKKIGIATTIAAGAATALQLLGIDGWSLFLTQCLDDIGNAKIVHRIGKGTNKLTSFMKQNWWLPPVLGAVAYIDNKYAPHLLESQSVFSRSEGGLLFSSGAIAGSLIANASDLVGNIINKLRKKQNEESLPELIKRSIKEGTHDHLSDRFKKFLWYGIAGSELLGSTLATSKGIMLGNYWSAFVDAGIGVFETAVPYADMSLGNHIATAADHIRDWVKVQRNSLRN